jgi:hypothetical protein
MELDEVRQTQHQRDIEAFRRAKAEDVPAIGTLDFTRYHLSGIRWTYVLDQFDYRKSAMRCSHCRRRFGYKPLSVQAL